MWVFCTLFTVFVENSDSSKSRLLTTKEEVPRFTERLLTNIIFHFLEVWKPLFSHIKAQTMLSYGLAAQLMMHEDTALANFFESKYEELRTMFLKPTAVKKSAITDVYDTTLSY